VKTSGTLSSRKPWTPSRVKKAREKWCAAHLTDAQRAGMTQHGMQAAFADALGKSWRSLYRWEQGEVEPDAALLDLWEARAGLTR
jgi:DNA-binding transcriptional regulator YiaG